MSSAAYVREGRETRATQKEVHTAPEVVILRDVVQALWDDDRRACDVPTFNWTEGTLTVKLDGKPFKLSIAPQ